MEKCFLHKRGQPLNFSKPLIIFIFPSFFPWWEKIGGKKIISTLEELFSGSCFFWEMPHSLGIISPTLYFHHPLGLGWLYFLYRLFPSGYKCSCKLSLTCMNEWMKEKGTLLTYMPLQMTALKECVCICVVVVVVAVLWTLWITLTLSLSSLSSPLPTKPKKMLKKHFVFNYHILYPEANPMVRKFILSSWTLFFLSSFLFTPLHVSRKNLNWKKKEERKEVKEGKK